MHVKVVAAERVLVHDRGAVVESLHSALRRRRVARGRVLRWLAERQRRLSIAAEETTHHFTRNIAASNIRADVVAHQTQLSDEACLAQLIRALLELDLAVTAKKTSLRLDYTSHLQFRSSG